jgi:type II secretion system protein G
MLKYFSKGKNKGFTLIELLVVIAIIGILSSVVVATLNSARTKARDAARVSDLKQIQVALELYYDSRGEYPDSLTKLKTDATGGTLPSVPTDPQGGPYLYAYKTVGTKITAYHVGANLEAASGATTLGSGDTDLDTYVDASTMPSGWKSTSGGTAPGINGGDTGDCTGDTAKGMCYDVSNVGTP